jgi:hypothetical protein
VRRRRARSATNFSMARTPAIGEAQHSGSAGDSFGESCWLTHQRGIRMTRPSAGTSGITPSAMRRRIVEVPTPNTCAVSSTLYASSAKAGFFCCA